MASPFLSSSWFKVAQLRPRLRTHTRIRRHRYRGGVAYVASDAVGGKAHRFSPGAYALVGRLDGVRTVDAIWHELVAELDNEAPTQDEVIATLHELHGADLLATDMAPDTEELFHRHKKQKWQIWTQNLKNPMSIRIPLVDPEAFLTRTIAYVRPLFGMVGLLLWLAIVAPAALIAGSHWTELTANLWDRVLAVDNLLIVALVYPMVKTVHELGHGYAAKANGCEVREMGVMFLLLYPIPYVDASATSGVKDKRQRALVGAAGMLAEMVLAAIATYVWVSVEPGLIRAIAFNVMLIGGISTLLVNGNPLLRFDGYYILSDLIEIPNLGSRANRYWQHLIDVHLFKTPDVKPFAATPGEKRWFLAYAPAAFVARMAMLFGISIVVAKRFFIIGVLMALWSVFTGIVVPIWKMGAHVVSSPHLHRNRKRAMRITGGALAALLLFLFVIPMPAHTSTQGVVWLPDEAHVRAGADGLITRVDAFEGQQVARGAALVDAENATLKAEVEGLESRVQQLDEQARFEATDDRVKLEIARVQIEEAKRKLDDGLKRLGKLDMKSGTPGTFMLADHPTSDLPGRFFKKGQVVGFVTPDHADVARVAVLQDDIDLVRQHLRGVSFKIAGWPSATYASRIVRAVPGARTDLPSAALSEAHGGPFATDPQDARKSFSRVFQFDIALPQAVRDVPFGTRVFVRFEHDPEPLGWQIGRRFRQLFLTQFNA